MAKAEAVELVRRDVRRLRDRAQLIVNDIEVNKCQMTTSLDGAGDSCEEALWALSTIQPRDVELMTANKQHPSQLVVRIMDCVLLVFQRPVNSVEMDDDKGCIRPSWNESVKVCQLAGSRYQQRDPSSYFKFQATRVYFLLTAFTLSNKITTD